MGRLICFFGIDGSGKTTLAKNVEQRIKEQGYEVTYIHELRTGAIFQPLVGLVQSLFLHNIHEGSDYKSYSEARTKAASRHPLLSILYEFFWLIDYFINIFFSVVLPNLFHENRVILLDRYLYDLVINMSLTMGYGTKWRQSHLVRWFRIIPKPSYSFFVDVPIEEAFRRKNDIPNLEFLTQRQVRYREDAQAVGAIFLDGTQPVDYLVKTVLSSIRLDGTAKSNRQKIEAVEGIDSVSGK